MASESARRVSILDVTIRDGSYAINYQYQPEQVGRIVAALDEAGIDYIEVSHGCGLGAHENMGLPAAASDAQYVAAAKAAAKRAKIGVIANPEPATLAKDLDAILDQVDFIRFATHCHLPRAIEKNLKYALKKRPDLIVFLQLMRSSRRPIETIVASAKAAEGMGIKTAYLVDTAGSMMPEQVFEMVSALRDACKIGIGFHGHNNLGLANANTLAAVWAGAESVDASLRGMGRAAGNAQLEALVPLLQRFGFAAQVDLDLLLDAGERFIVPVMPESRGIDAIDVITADANIDLYPLSIFQQIAANAGIDFITLIRTLGEDDETVDVGIEEVRRALTKLGVDPVAVFQKLNIKID